MAIIGKIVGGVLGFAVGGPLGALLGAVAGHGLIDRSRSRAVAGGNGAVEADAGVVFALGVIALSAKVAKADGTVTRDEIRTFQRIFPFDADERGRVADLYNEARRSADGFEAYAEQVRGALAGKPELLAEVVDALYAIAAADGELHPAEEGMIARIGGDFRRRRLRDGIAPRPPCRRLRGRRRRRWGQECYGRLCGARRGAGRLGRRTARRTGKAGLPWGGTYSGDPLPAAVALKQLQIVLRDNLAEQAAARGARLRAGLEALARKYDIVGEVRGTGLYYLLDIVETPESRRPDPAMAERIRYNALLEGLVTIAVKNFIRVCPALIITEAEIDETLSRLETALQRSMDGFPRDLDYATSSSLAARPAAAAAT